MLYPIREDEGGIKGRKVSEEDNEDEVVMKRQMNTAEEGETDGQGPLDPSDSGTEYIGEGSSNLGQVMMIPTFTSTVRKGPSVRKTKSNGYIMFLHSVKREQGEEKSGMTTNDLIREFDHLWKDLPEDERSHWREKAKRRNAGQNEQNTADIAYVSIVQPKRSRDEEVVAGGQEEEDKDEIKIEKTAVSEEDDWGIDFTPVETGTYDWKLQQERVKRTQEDKDSRAGSSVPIRDFNWSAGL